MPRLPITSRPGTKRRILRVDLPEGATMPGGRFFRARFAVYWRWCDLDRAIVGGRLRRDRAVRAVRRPWCALTGHVFRWSHDHMGADGYYGVESCARCWGSRRVAGRTMKTYGGD